jgi:uncharacterized membrane-anchored protein
MSNNPVARRRDAPDLVSRVPDITLSFWVIKVLTTGMGETTSDFAVKAIDPLIAVALGAAALIFSLLLQFKFGRYVPSVYWLAVVMVSIFGTMAADVLHVAGGVPYAVSSSFYAVVLAIIFMAWFAKENTLSIHTVFTRRREAFYWATVLATFALGTAAGDLTAMTLGWGYFLSGVLFAVVFAVPATAYWLFERNAVFTFWSAYIVTRPLGASFADWMGKPVSLGGLGWGDGPVSIAGGILIAGLVGYLAITHRDSRDNTTAPAREAKRQR